MQTHQSEHEWKTDLPADFVAMQAAMQLEMQLHCWTNGKTDIAALIHAANCMGIWVKPFFGERENCASYGRQPDGTEFILINRAFTTDRRKAALAHELAECMVLRGQLDGLKYNFLGARFCIPVDQYAHDADFRHQVACRVERYFCRSAHLGD